MREIWAVIIRTYRLYKYHVAVMLPLIGITTVGLFVERIPYLNLYKDTVLTGILAVDWFVILWLSRLKSSTMFLIGFFLFSLTFPMYYLKLDWYVESVANLCYIIFCTAIIFELINNFFEKPVKTKSVPTKKRTPKSQKRHRKS